MGGRPSIAFIFVNKQNQQARKTYILVSLMFSIWRQCMAIIRQFAAVLKKNRNSRVISSRLPLEIALFALKHMAKN